VRVLFVTRPHLPRVGGAQLTTHELALGLEARGHEVSLLAEERPLRPQDDLVGPPAEGLPYPVVESAQLACDMPALLSALRPEVVVVEGRRRQVEWSRSALLAARELPTVLHLQCVGSEQLAFDADLEVDGTVTVSRFLARHVGSSGGETAVVPPGIDPARLRPPERPRVALMVTPTREKGVDAALALARARPDVQFALARAWQPRPDAFAGLDRRVTGLPNVELLSATFDAGELYADCRVLLVPSVEPEGFGRVAAEASMLGIPVIASRIGGLPEATGEDTVLLDPGAGIDDWAGALESVWKVGSRTRPAPRPEVHPRRVAARFEACLRAAVERRCGS
jgi:glycosyltransferase involved in cell wall biosynthesis